jgi:hypothetical protein
VWTWEATEGIRNVSAGGVVASASKKGFVTVSIDASDADKNTVALTPVGLEVLLREVGVGFPMFPSPIAYGGEGVRADVDTISRRVPRAHADDVRAAASDAGARADAAEARAASLARELRAERKRAWRANCEIAPAARLAIAEAEIQRERERAERAESEARAYAERAERAEADAERADRDRDALRVAAAGRTMAERDRDDARREVREQRSGVSIARRMFRRAEAELLACRDALDASRVAEAQAEADALDAITDANKARSAHARAVRVALAEAERAERAEAESATLRRGAERAEAEAASVVAFGKGR